MGKALLTFGETQREVPLAAVTTIGRSPDSTWVMDHPCVPYTWLEIRWAGHEWAWRARTEKERTLGPLLPCTTLGGSWRRLETGTRRVAVPGAWVQLVDSRPPGALYVDVEANRAATPAEAKALDRIRPLDAVRVALNGATYRYYAADPPDATRTRLERKPSEVDAVPDADLASPDVPRKKQPRGLRADPVLDADDASTSFRFFKGRSTWICEVRAIDEDGRTVSVGSVKQACVAAVVPYVRARLRSGGEGGHLEKDMAVEEWRDLLAAPDRPASGLYQAHGKFKDALRKRVLGAERFFEEADRHSETKRIRVPARRLRLEEPAPATPDNGARGPA